MNMLVNCAGCGTPLQLPPGAPSIRCALCHAITYIADPRTAPPAQPSSASPFAPQPLPPANESPPPSPYGHVPPGPPPNAHGRKRAVICGISYKFSRYELKGCINDARCMKYLLINKFTFPPESILMFTDGSAGVCDSCSSRIVDLDGRVTGISGGMAGLGNAWLISRLRWRTGFLDFLCQHSYELLTLRREIMISMGSSMTVNMS
ncbi:hypothetical protein G4B88_000666 [Cannabis sativa]|uniref:Zinc finger LSD1-type domain-containing protein n=1 Tax=Cannabis sativa TaxID=3483 RepID=A0A7J6HGG8_CANSA|nr:hypothetical protein G4B88_000666 [Cannabis sativa]